MKSKAPRQTSKRHALASSILNTSKHHWLNVKAIHIQYRHKRKYFTTTVQLNVGLLALHPSQKLEVFAVVKFYCTHAAADGR